MSANPQPASLVKTAELDRAASSGSPTSSNQLARTDCTGKCFISYRRSHVSDVESLIGAMLDVGVPPWQDRRDIRSVPLGPALREAIASNDVGSALLWVTRNFAESEVVHRLEEPEILERERRRDGFFVETCLADDIAYEDAPSFCAAARNQRHLERVGVEAVAGAAGQAWRMVSGEPQRVAARVLDRRIRAVALSLDSTDPLRIHFNAFGGRPDHFAPGYAAILNWSRHFDQRFASPQTWKDVLLPALAALYQSCAAHGQGRAASVSGPASITAGLALGHTFREVTGLRLIYEHQNGQNWCLNTASSGNCGYAAEPLEEPHVAGSELAVLVCVTGDVRSAFDSTFQPSGNLKFGGLIKIRPSDGSARRDIANADEASGLARFIAKEIGEARQRLRTIRRTHLFFNGPVGVAMLLGQLLNAQGPIVCYEHQQADAIGFYRESATLGTYTPKQIATRIS